MNFLWQAREAAEPSIKSGTTSPLLELDDDDDETQSLEISWDSETLDMSDRSSSLEGASMRTGSSGHWTISERDLGHLPTGTSSNPPVDSAIQHAPTEDDEVEQVCMEAVEDANIEAIVKIWSQDEEDKVIKSTLKRRAIALGKRHATRSMNRNEVAPMAPKKEKAPLQENRVLAAKENLMVHRSEVQNCRSEVRSTQSVSQDSTSQDEELVKELSLADFLQTMVESTQNCCCPTVLQHVEQEQ